MVARLRGLFTIPAGVPFLDTLAIGMLNATGGDPEALANARLFLPTRRACAAMADAFLRVTDGAATLLPRLEPLGDIEPEDWHEPFGAAAVASQFPPAISPARRRFLLAQLVMRRQETSPDQALQLADALAQWLDQVQIHDLDTARLAGLVAEEYAEHWAETLKFLGIVTEYWPSILAQERVMDPVLRRRAIIAAQVEAWRQDPPQSLVVAAGSTGSLPSTAALMAAIQELRQGCIVLPGLDTDLPGEMWPLLQEGHPQYGLGRLLASLGREAASVPDWPTDRPVAPGRRLVRQGRAALVRAALAPAEASIDPAADRGVRAGLDGLVQVEASGPEAEARVIALRLREFLEASATGTAMLVTADRNLGKRVAAEMGRWGVEIDDSAGMPLGETMPGVFLRLVAETALSGLAPVPLLAMLKHPLAAFDADLVAGLEGTCLRGLRPAPGIEGLRAQLAESKHQALLPLLEKIENGLRPLADALHAQELFFAEWLTGSVGAAELLADTGTGDGANRLWRDESGEALAGFIEGLLSAAADFPPVSGQDFLAMLQELLARETLRPRFRRHPRLAIVGPLEARLHCPDLAILGGMNEGSWPPEPQHDPWMGRPMRQDFGLPLPEWRIGLAAHDFCQAIAAPEVLITRAERVDGTPTVAARWLPRLELAARMATGTTADDAPNPMAAGADRWLRWQELLDVPVDVTRLPLPAARPPVEARFRDLPVTQAENWVTDPYGYYARSILRLRKLDPVDQAPDASDRGQILHTILHRFISGLPGEWPENAWDRLVAIGRHEFGGLLDRPGIRAFWWPRFLLMAEWFVAHEAGRQEDLKQSLTEHVIAAPLAVEDLEIGVSARLDRLDRFSGGGAAIIDYKSGALPVAQRIGEGWPPQLPLEAALALRHLQPGGAPPEISLEAWRVSGAGDSGGEAKTLAAAQDAVKAADAAWRGVTSLIQQFRDPSMPYLAEPRALLAPRFNDYRHLARRSEEAVGDE